MDAPREGDLKGSGKGARVQFCARPLRVYAVSGVNVPSAGDGGVTGIMIHVVMNADKRGW